MGTTSLAATPSPALDLLLSAAVTLHHVRLRTLVLLGPMMRSRTFLRRDIRKTLEDVEMCAASANTLDMRTRVLLLTPARPMPANADDDAIAAYVEGVAHGASVAELADRVCETGWPALMARFVRAVGGDEGVRVRKVSLVMNVMNS
jgi:hypothetical protein